MVGACAFWMWLATAGWNQAQTQEAPESVEPPLQITSDGANRYEGGIYYAEDNVTVTYGGDVLMADQVHFNPTTKEATAKGNVRLYMMDQIYRGDLLTYNFRTKKILSEKFRFLDGKMMVEGSRSTRLRSVTTKLTEAITRPTTGRRRAGRSRPPPSASIPTTRPSWKTRWPTSATSRFSGSLTWSSTSGTRTPRWMFPSGPSPGSGSMPWGLTASPSRTS